LERVMRGVSTSRDQVLERAAVVGLDYIGLRPLVHALYDNARARTRCGAWTAVRAYNGPPGIERMTLAAVEDR
jgi:hypothetical protein